MNPGSILLNEYIVLFLSRPGKNRHCLSATRVNRVHWATEMSEAHMRLTGSSKDAEMLLNVETGDLFYFCYTEHGDRTDYSKGDPVATFLVSKVKRRWIPNLAIASPYDMETLQFCIGLKGELTLNL